MSCLEKLHIVRLPSYQVLMLADGICGPPKHLIVPQMWPQASQFRLPLICFISSAEKEYTI